MGCKSSKELESHEKELKKRLNHNRRVVHAQVSSSYDAQPHRKQDVKNKKIEDEWTYPKGLTKREIDPEKIEPGT